MPADEVRSRLRAAYLVAEAGGARVRVRETAAGAGETAAYLVPDPLVPGALVLSTDPAQAPNARALARAGTSGVVFIL